MPRWVDEVRGALSGAIGDTLAQAGNPLAIEMTLAEGGAPLRCDPRSLAKAYPEAKPHVVVFVHGLSCVETVWRFPASTESYGSRLASELGITSLHLRYNSGLRISQNGASFARLLETLFSAYPVPIERLSLVGHSMGGLVIRSAFAAAEREQLGWLPRVRHAIYVGSPHLGAPLEKAANLTSRILRAVGLVETELLADAFDLRSVGIKDLRHGNLVDGDWEGSDPHAIENLRAHVPLPDSVRHHLVVGLLSKNERHLANILFGDLMVRADSALGRHPVAPFETDFVRTFAGISHLSLAHHPEVYETVRDWIRQP